MLGCDSLAVTRIVRALYASHHGIFNSRTLGGKHGALDGPFAVRYVFQARNLGEYVSWLDSHQLCQRADAKEIDSRSDCVDVATPSVTDTCNATFDDQVLLYDSLLEAITMNHCRIALALLALGIDPALSEHGGRLAKVSGRLAMRKLFKSNPLHLSCMQGQPVLVRALLRLGYSCKSPDANGSFPIHLVCLKLNEAAEDVQKVGNEDRCTCTDNSDIDGDNRSKCLQLLLEDGKVPLTIKDGNKQTILHCVARTGCPVLAQCVIRLWREGGESGQVPTTYGAELGGIWDWRDRWYRTPVQWAVLNGHLATLRLLLLAGCNPKPPPSRRPNRSTSAENEAPVEICERLYLHASSSAEKQEVGEAIMRLLNASYPPRN
jgi:hypothetical protein